MACNRNSLQVCSKFRFKFFGNTSKNPASSLKRDFFSCEKGCVLFYLLKDNKY